MTGEPGAVQRIAQERERAVARIDALERDLALLFEATAASPDDEHDPEGATVAFERAQVSALLEQARRHLEGLDAAAEHLREGTYGVCDACGGRIGADRLEARPTATRCIACATESR